MDWSTVLAKHRAKKKAEEVEKARGDAQHVDHITPFQTCASHKGYPAGQTNLEPGN